jgi:uncharacterized protein DUF1905
MPSSLGGHHEDERSVDQLGVAGGLREMVEVVGKPSLKAGWPHPLGHRSHAVTVASGIGGSGPLLPADRTLHGEESGRVPLQRRPASVSSGYLAERAERRRLLREELDHYQGEFGAGGARQVEECGVEWTFDGEIIEWRGPAPYYFVAMPESDSADLKEQARALIYWDQVPVRVVIGDTEFRTALFPRGGRYLVPLKEAVRQADGISEGDVVTVVLRPAPKA